MDTDKSASENFREYGVAYCSACKGVCTQVGAYCRYGHIICVDHGCYEELTEEYPQMLKVDSDGSDIVDHGWLPSYECSGCKREIQDKKEADELSVKKKLKDDAWITELLEKKRKQFLKLIRMVSKVHLKFITKLPGTHRKLSKMAKKFKKRMRKISTYALTRK